MARLGLLIVGALTILALSLDWINSDENSERLVLSRPVRSPETGAVAEGRGRRRKVKNYKKRGMKKRRMGRKKKKGSQRKKKKKNINKNRSNLGKTVSDSCYEETVTIMRMWKDVISNFEKQKRRMTKQNSTGMSKTGKKGLFDSVYQKLLSAGGGDKTHLSCAGSTNSPGAAQLTNLTSSLSSCQTDIPSACDPSSWPQPNMTKLLLCSELSTRFRAGAQECLDLTVGANKAETATACGCWTNSDLAKTVEAAKVCKFPSEAGDIARALKGREGLIQLTRS